MRRATCFALACLLLVVTGAGEAGAQCLLANPSFEIAGSGGSVFGGWNQFGPVGWTSAAPHGHRAARVSGPDQGGWDVAAFWQPLDTAPGERWSVSAKVWHSTTKPLTGQSRAIVNIEWRDAGGGLISYESHDAASATTPAGEVQDFAVVSGPAPANAASTRLLLAVLQAPGEPVPDVFYDQATFDNLGPPTVDEIQWNDFGGSTLEFSGRTWRVKGPGYYGPGPSSYCATSSCTWVDAADDLHLTVRRIGGTWYSTEVTLEEPLGYGDYIFTTRGRLDTLDPHVVLGMFLWEYRRCYDPADGWWNPYNEIDVEFSRWGNPANDIGQFVAQPFDWPGNLSRFAATFTDGEITSHAFRWLPDRVEYRSWRGGPSEETPGNLIHSWTYTGPHIPRPEQPRVHLNLWQYDGPPGSDQEVVLDAFTFVPEGGAVAAPEVGPSAAPSAGLLPAWPNPSAPPTTIRWTMTRAEETEIAVYDVAGRLVRTLVRGPVPAGSHEVVWNGRDDSGRRVSSGVYLYRLRAGDAVETRRLVLLR